ncbi:MAG TPA: hypothetical protein VF670_17225 [Duganella sp.]
MASKIKPVFKEAVRHLKWPTSISSIFTTVFVTIVLGGTSNATEGTKGWYYLGRPGSTYKVQFAATPMGACSSLVLPIWRGGLINVAPAPNANGTAYICWHKAVNDKHPPIGWPTHLHCETGYRPRFPGVCVKRIKNADRTIPPVRPAPPEAPLECSASNPGFTIGNPVIITNGTKVQQESDIGGNQWGTLEIGRVYRNARDTVDAPTAGTLWSFTFERQFLAMESVGDSAPKRISIINGEGSAIHFDRTGTAYSADSASEGQLYPLTPNYDEWIYKNASGEMEHFKKIKSRYVLMSVTRKDGNGTRYSYGDNEKLQTISDSFGRTLDVAWHDDYAIASLSSPESSVHYRYEQLLGEDGVVVRGMQRIVGVQVNNADGAALGVKQYHYGQGWPDWFHLTGVTDENNIRFATYSYDAEGRVSRSEHAGGAQRYEYSYPADTSRLVTDPLGSTRSITTAPIANQLRITSFSQPGGSGCGPAASAYAYTAKGMLQSRSDFNNIKTCFAYDTARDLEISRVDGVPVASSCPAAASVPGVGQRKTSRRWHPDWSIETMVAEPLKVTQYVYNGQPDIDGDVASCGDGGTLPDGKPIAVVCKKIETATTDAHGAAGFNAVRAGAPRITTHTYNRHGQILSSTVWGRAGSHGDTTHFDYYTDTTSSHTMGDLSKVTGPTGQVREFLAYTFSGLATRIKEPNGQLIELTYDARRHLTRRVVSATGTGEQATSYHYDLVGQLTGVDLPDSSRITYRYDDAHRLTGITDTAGNTVQYALDPMGNRVREEIHDATGKLTRQIVRIYDALNRLQAVTEGVQ